MANTNRPTVKTRNANVIAGIDKHLTANVTIGGVPYTPANLKEVFQVQSTALDTSDMLHKQWQDQVQAAQTASAKANTVYQSLRAYLIGLYGTGSKAILNDFGMSPPRKTPLTAEAKAAAAVKSAATRAARRTMGKKQEKAVKGAVTGITVTPIVASSPVVSTPVSPAPKPTG